MRKTVVRKFNNDDSLQGALNQFLAQLQEEHPLATIVGIASHPARSCSDNSLVVYTFLYDEGGQDVRHLAPG